MSVEGDLLEQDLEAIVNPWNRNLFPWGILLPQGVSGAIKKHGDVQPFKELREIITIHAPEHSQASGEHAGSIITQDGGEDLFTSALFPGGETVKEFKKCVKFCLGCLVRY